MDKKIKIVPKGAIKSVATLVYPPEFTDEFPSSWYNKLIYSKYLNLSLQKTC